MKNNVYYGTMIMINSCMAGITAITSIKGNYAMVLPLVIFSSVLVSLFIGLKKEDKTK